MPWKPSGTVKPRVILMSGRTICKRAVEKTSSAWNLPPCVKPLAGIFIAVSLLLWFFAGLIIAHTPRPGQRFAQKTQKKAAGRAFFRAVRPRGPVLGARPAGPGASGRAGGARAEAAGAGRKAGQHGFILQAFYVA